MEQKYSIGSHQECLFSIQTIFKTYPIIFSFTSFHTSAGNISFMNQVETKMGMWTWYKPNVDMILVKYGKPPDGVAPMELGKTKKYPEGKQCCMLVRIQLIRILLTLVYKILN